MSHVNKVSFFIINYYRFEYLILGEEIKNSEEMLHDVREDLELLV